MTTNVNTKAIAAAVSTLCQLGDKWDATIIELKALVKGITSKKELRGILIVPVAAHYGLELKTGERGSTFATKSEVAQKRLTRIMTDVMGKGERAEIEIEFADKLVTDMQKVLKALEDYAEYEVDGKKVGAAKALALLVAEAKDRI